jgi:hypothetical protein
MVKDTNDNRRRFLKNRNNRNKSEHESKSSSKETTSKETVTVVPKQLQAADGTLLWPVLKGDSADEFLKWCEIAESYNADSYELLAKIFAHPFDNDRQYPEPSNLQLFTPPENTSDAEKNIYNIRNAERIKLYEKEYSKLISKRPGLLGLIKQRIHTVSLLDKVKEDENEWKAIERDNDPLRLLKRLAKVIVSDKRTKKNPIMTKLQATTVYNDLKMEAKDTPITFKQKMINAILVMKSVDATIPSEEEQAMK